MRVTIDQAILDRLRKNDPTLTELDLREMKLGDEQVLLLCQSLARNTVLRELDLQDNQITYVGATALAQNTGLRWLCLGDNQIGDAGAIALAQNMTLTELFLWNNQIGDVGATAFAQNTMLKTLDLRFNEHTAASIEALTQNLTLTFVDTGGRAIYRSQEKVLRLRLQLNREQQARRRWQWINTVVTLAADTVDSRSTSLWSRLPFALVLKIFSYVTFSGQSTIGKDSLQVYCAARYILEHITAIQAAEQRGQRFTLTEHVRAPLPSDHRFSLEFHPISSALPAPRSDLCQSGCSIL